MKFIYETFPTLLLNILAIDIAFIIHFMQSHSCTQTMLHLYRIQIQTQHVYNNEYRKSESESDVKINESRICMRRH